MEFKVCKNPADGGGQRNHSMINIPFKHKTEVFYRIFCLRVNEPLKREFIHCFEISQEIICVTFYAPEYIRGQFQTFVRVLQLRFVFMTKLGDGEQRFI